MKLPVIYHGTPLTPRAALNAIMPGRAACVSFYRPEDLEAVLAVCPQLMFRPRGVQLLDAGDARRQGMGRGGSAALVAGVLRLARSDAFLAGTLGDHSGQPRSALSGQRRPLERLAVRRSRCSGLAHGRTDRAARAVMRAVPAGLPRLDRASQIAAGRVRGLFSQDGRGRPPHGQYVAPAAHASRDSRRAGISVPERRQHQPRAERPSI